MLKRKLKPTSPQSKLELKMTIAQIWQGLIRDYTQNLVMYRRHRFKAVIACEGMTNKILNMN
uniref:Uncharacterized protein n=1 Tax=Anguilla anguilla TaxID=7936 RepID=A0A0E9VIA9_ANGAN